MAQQLIRAFLSDLVRAVDLPDPVVEFGALQVEADQDGDMRPLFAGRPYLGTDVREGPGVDRVEDLRSLSFGDGEIGTALCLDTLEHCQDPVTACRELHRVTAAGGVCVITSVMLMGIHGYPHDYFRFTPDGFRSLLEGFDDVWVLGVGHEDIPTQVIGVGAKERALELSTASFPSVVDFQRGYDAARGRVRIGVHNFPPREVLGAVARAAPRLARERLGRA